MDVLLVLECDALVRERLREMDAERRAADLKRSKQFVHGTEHTHALQQDEHDTAELGETELQALAEAMALHNAHGRDCNSDSDSLQQEVLALQRCVAQQQMYRMEAQEIDAQQPQRRLERKLIVLRAGLEQLYCSAEQVMSATSDKTKLHVDKTSKQAAVGKRGATTAASSTTTSSLHKAIESDAASSALPFSDLPLATQLGLRIFFRFCTSLQDPERLASSSRILLQVAARLPSLLAALPPFPLSPGFAISREAGSSGSASLRSIALYDSSGSPNVLSVFQSLFQLLSSLLAQSCAPAKTLSSTSAASASVFLLGANDRAMVLTAYTALALKWGSLRHLLTVIHLLLTDDASPQFEQLEPLFADVTGAVPEMQLHAREDEDAVAGFLMSFGKGDHGKLGHGQCSHSSCADGNCTENKSSPTLVSATRDTHFARIDSLSTHSVAVTTRGEVMAWGNGDKYRLGHGSASKEYTPKVIESISAKGRVLDVSCGLGHTIALLESGELFAWGNGSNGRLGLGDTTDRAAPTLVPTTDVCASRAGSRTAKQQARTLVFRRVYCGASHSLALSVDGRVFAWGKNNQGQCGHGHTNDQLTVQDVAFFRDDVDEDIVHAAGGWEHTLFCAASGRVYSAGCGYKDSRRTGIPPVLGHGNCERRTKPTVIQFFVDNNDEIARVACGWDHSLAVTTAGLVYSWGSGTNGKLGHGDEENCDVPTLIRAMENKQVRVAKAGCEHTVLLTDDHEAWTFGQGDSGRLGHGDNVTRKAPTRIEAFSQSGVKPVAIAVGDKYNLVLVEEMCHSEAAGYSRSSTLHTHPLSSGGVHVGLDLHHRKRRSSLLRRELQRQRSMGASERSPSQHEADWVLAVGENLQKQARASSKSSDDGPISLKHKPNEVRSAPEDDNSTSASQQVQQVFLPQTRSECVLFLLGHIDRLSTAYFDNDGDDSDAMPSIADDHSDNHALHNQAACCQLPFAVDTSGETFALLLRILRLQCAANGDGSPFALLQRMGVTLSCLRILKTNVSRLLRSETLSTLDANVKSTLELSMAVPDHLEPPDTLEQIHALVNALACADASRVLEIFGAASCCDRDASTNALESLSELRNIARAVSREAAQVLRVRPAMFSSMRGHCELRLATSCIDTWCLPGRLCALLPTFKRPTSAAVGARENRRTRERRASHADARARESRLRGV